MMPRIPLLTACVVAALLATTACGSAGTSATATHHGASGIASTAAAVSTEAASTDGGGTKPGMSGAGPEVAGCPDPGWAYKVTDAGTVAWHAGLPNTPGLYSDPQPVAVGGVSVFGHGGAIYALRLSDGHQEWRRVFAAPEGSLAGAISGLWTWDGSVVALVGPYGLVQPVGAAADRLLSLNPETGAVRWTLNLGGDNPVYGSMAVTSNGVLALVRQGGALEAADLTTGTLLWSRAYTHQEDSDGPVASGTVVVAAVNGTVSGFDAITGRLRWRRGGMPSTVDVIAGPGGRVLSYDILQQVTPVPKDLFPVTALSAATGRVLWRLPTAGPVSMISAQQGWITVGTSGTYRLYLVNPATGRARWSVATYVANDMTWVLTPADLVYLSEYQPPESAAGVTEVVDRRLATGAVRWSVRLLDGSDGAVVRPSGPDVLVTENAGSARPAVLAIDLATGRPRPATALPQITVASPVVSGGSALLALGAPPCADPGPAASQPYQGD